MTIGVQEPSDENKHQLGITAEISSPGEQKHVMTVE